MTRMENKKRFDKKISFSDAQYCEGDRDDLWD
jgi:hypothetical protein